MSIVNSAGARVAPERAPDPEKPACRPLGDTVPDVRSRLVSVLKGFGYEDKFAESLFSISRAQVFVDRRRARERASREPDAGPQEDAA